MISKIFNTDVAVEVNSIGAELMSIKTQRDGMEFLWQGDPKYWKRRAPLLFPVVGIFEKDRYMYKEKEYEIELHGFIKDCNFELLKSSETSLEYRFSSNEATFLKYPFEFELYVSYHLSGSEVKIGRTVVNKSDGKMWFSIGEHPGFRCPLFDNETMEDYYLDFKKNEHINRRFVEDGLQTGQQELFLCDENEVRLSKKLFERRVIILKGLESNCVELRSSKNNRTVKVRFKGYPYMGIWSPETGAPFVCIEPWYGITSSKNGIEDIREKEGILSIDPKELFECGYSIDVTDH